MAASSDRKNEVFVAPASANTTSPADTVSSVSAASPDATLDASWLASPTSNMTTEVDEASKMLANATLSSGSATSTSGSDGATDKAHLSNMPPELFNVVARDIDVNDRVSLRFACRGTSAKVSDAYVEDHFTDYSLLLRNKESLENACQMARHPVFGAAIRKVTIFVDRLRACHINPQNRGRRWTKKQLFDALDRPNKFPLLDHITKDYYLALVNRTHRLLDDQDDLYKTGRGLPLLVDFFSILKTHGGVQEVEIAAEVEKRNRKACTLRNVNQVRDCFKLRKAGFQYVSPSTKHRWPFSIILEALYRSSIAVGCLDVGTVSPYGRWSPPWGIRSDALCAQPGMCKMAEKVLSQVERAGLHVGRDSAQADYFTCLLDVLSAAPKLTTLHLDFSTGEESDYDMYPSFRMTMNYKCIVALLPSTFPHLKELSLAYLDLDLSDLATFIHQQKELKLLRLRQVNLYGCGDVVSRPRYGGWLLNTTSNERTQKLGVLIGRPVEYCSVRLFKGTFSTGGK